MTLKPIDYLAPVTAAIAFAAVLCVFAAERHSFREAVISWARHDLVERTELAANRLKDPLETGDFAAIHDFGAKCAADGIRLVVRGHGGGLVFDSVRAGTERPEAIYETRPTGEWTVTLGMPLARVLAPYARAGWGFLLAALAGAAGVLLVFFSTYRQRVRFRELERTERFRREFTADISHEIKTPLTGIIGAVDMLCDSAPPPDSGVQKTLLTMIRSESVRLDELARNIIDLSRLERPDGALTLTETDLAELIREETAHLESVAAKAGVSLRTSLPKESCMARVDAQLVARMVSNLVINAIRHSGAKEVLIGLERTNVSKRVAKIFVEDHGKGIPEADRERVFERFYRVDKSRESSSGGSGLGLAIVRRIARLHSGDAALETVFPSGCRFTVTLPR